MTKNMRFLRFALFSSALAFSLLLLGAWGRLSTSGLGCPDWPGCYGKLFAPATPAELSEAQALAPKVDASEIQLWKDTLHRYLSGALGLLMFRLMYLGWELKKYQRRQQIWLPALVFVVVYTQVFLSLLTHKLAFQPLVVMSQLMLGMAALGLLWWVVLREQRLFRPVVEAPATVLAALRPRAMIALILVIVQIVLGAWVSVNLSALACPDFPTCRQGVYWPDMDFADGFILWRDLGLDYDGRLLNLSAATAIHMAHRVGAVITFLYVGWLALHTIRIGGQGNLCRYGLLVLAVLLAQTALGVALVVAHLPLVLAVAHHALAALMLVTLITYNHVLRTPGRK